MTGSHTIQLLLKRGHTVRVLAHKGCAHETGST